MKRKLFILLILQSMIVTHYVPAAGSFPGDKDRPVDRCLKGVHPAPESEKLVIRNVILFDGTGRQPKRAYSIIVEGARIKKVAADSDIEVPAGAKVYDGDGKYAIPGLWDMHVHLKNATSHALPVLIANGVTGIRDMAGGFEEIEGMRRDIESGEIVGPRIILSGPSIESPESVARAKASGKSEDFDVTRIVVSTPDEAAEAIEKLRKLGVDFVKIRTWPSEEVYFAIVKAARRAGIQIAGHSPEALDPLKVAPAGQSSFEHGFYPFPLSKYSKEERDKVIKAFSENRVAIVPTIVAWSERTVPLEKARSIVSDESNLIEPARRYAAPELVEYWGKQLLDRKPTSEEGLRSWSGAIDTMASDLGVLYENGVRVMPGTDLAAPLVVPGFSLHDELSMLVSKVGMTPREAIESATRVPSEFLGLDPCLGTIEKGKLADILILDADPLADIRNTRKINAVILSGRYIGRSELDTLLAKAARLHEVRR